MTTTTTTTTEISKSKAQRFKDHWHELRDAHALIDYEMAKLALDVRAEFPKGPSGDWQFRGWCIEHLQVRGSRARMFMDASNAIRAFPVSAAWRRYGGWRSICFLMHLPSSKRSGVIIEVEGIVKRLGHATTYYTVKDVAMRQGIFVVNKYGRPNQTMTERKLNVLRLFVRDLYANRKGLPTLPKSVQAALEIGVRGEMIARADAAQQTQPAAAAA